MNQKIVQDEANVRRLIEALPDDAPGVAFDIGANFGIYTKILATKFQDVYAFEPDPSNMFVLQENIKEPNVHFVRAALGRNPAGMVNLYRCWNPGGSTINEECPRFAGWGHTWDNFISVPETTLDTFTKSYIPWNNLKFIKCDVEGAETFLFEHGKDTLLNNRLTMVLEVHQTVNFARLYQLFKEVGYQVYDIFHQPVSELTYDAYYIVTNE